ncbi:unnamed protein product [Nezara viridula]|uniref:Uncharacterized protein n=1 Tax=Nezara viridula TaxID=85310 RepID=A0A9P0HUF5_NEZVI|nr:unnamed protein product [Nezara viridula]
MPSTIPYDSRSRSEKKMKYEQDLGIEDITSKVRLLDDNKLQSFVGPFGKTITIPPEVKVAGDRRTGFNEIKSTRGRSLVPYRNFLLRYYLPLGRPGGFSNRPLGK